MFPECFLMAFAIGREGRRCKGANKLKGISALAACMLIANKALGNIKSQWLRTVWLHMIILYKVKKCTRE